MKFVALILSIYIFALNLVPCEDNGICDDEVETEFSKVSDHDHQHQNADLCSPFCQCQCCHIHVTYFTVIDYSLSNTLISTERFHYSGGMEKDFNTSILQPPRT